MKWVAIAGTWRTTNAEVEEAVREEVRQILARGDSIISGGALRVDQIATDEALRLGADKDRLKIFLPSILETYRAHYLRRAEEGVITKEQAQELLAQLEEVQKRDCLVEGAADALNKETYFERITQIIEAADELVAFQVNHSGGTQDTIDKARTKGIPVKVFSYSIP